MHASKLLILLPLALFVCTCGNPDRVLDRPSARAKLAEEFSARTQGVCTMRVSGRESRNAVVRCDTTSLETMQAAASQECARYQTFGFDALTLQSNRDQVLCTVEDDCACVAALAP